MRVAVCEVLGEVLVRVLSGDKLDDSGRADRDRFLDTLQEHIHDTHSHVRARVLQVYTRIVNSKVSVFVMKRNQFVCLRKPLKNNFSFSGFAIMSIHGSDGSGCWSSR